MNKSFFALFIVAGCSAVNAHSNECGFSTDYNVEVNEQNLLFTRSHGDRIEFIDDKLMINDRAVELTDSQLAASQGLQQKTRKAVKDIAEIAVEGAELGLKAVSIVSASLFADEPQIQKDLIEPIEALGAKIKANISPTRFNGEGLQLSLDDGFEKQFEQGFESAMSKHAGKMIGNLLGKLFSGDSEELSDFEFRMENMEHDIKTYVEANAEQIEKKGNALCEELKILESYDTILENVEGYPKGGLFVPHKGDHKGHSVDID